MLWVLYKAYEIPPYGNMNANTIKKRGFNVETAGCAEALTLVGQSPGLLLVTSYGVWNGRHMLGLHIMNLVGIKGRSVRCVNVCTILFIHQCQYCTADIPKVSAPLNPTTKRLGKPENRFHSRTFLPLIENG